MKEGIMNNVLVLVEDYPNNAGGVTLMYVHTRNLYYKNCGIDVTVLNFKADNDYVIDGIEVICGDSYLKNKKKYSILLLHAANIKHHYRFIKKHGHEFEKFIFFYHGHEVLRCNKVYSKPYPYVRKSSVKALEQDLYDTFKLFIWRKYLPKVKDKSYFIFVSKWMKDEFLKWTKIDESMLLGRSSITYNSIGIDFEKNQYDENQEKEFDFCTIRGNLDGSKYSIDIVNRLALNTPNKKFVVVGKGDFFNHYEKAPNITWLNQTMNHNEIIELLQKSRFALMPTRTDAQGLMMCEMAAFGIPLITSNIPVCHEVFEDFSNAYFIDNETNESLDRFTPNMSVCRKHTRFYKDITVKNEVEIIEKIINQ